MDCHKKRVQEVKLWKDGCKNTARRIIARGLLDTFVPETFAKQLKTSDQPPKMIQSYCIPASIKIQLRIEWLWKNWYPSQFPTLTAGEIYGLFTTILPDFCREKLGNRELSLLIIPTCTARQQLFYLWLQQLLPIFRQWPHIAQQLKGP